MNNLFGKDFKDDEKFKKAVEDMTNEIRQRRIQQNNAGVGGGASSGLAKVKATKRSQKRPEFKDYVMEILGQQSFYGIFLRVNFWINKIVRSLNDERREDFHDKSIEFSLTGVQKMVMRNVILYLLHQRD